MNSDRTLPWDWYPGRVPENVQVKDHAYLETTYSFNLFRSTLPDALEIGEASSIYLGVMFDLGPQARLKIGNYVLMNGARIICDREITIGDYCLISWNVVLMDTYRVPVAPAARRQTLELAARSSQSSPTLSPNSSPRHVTCETEARPIRIEANVWVGFDCCILPGVTIGEGSVIGARSVVVSDVPPFTVAVGNPARVLRELK
jgi:acetyltransferase-like isoleucine patch superfamily enzyme